MIGTRRESQSLYHLNLSSAPIACIVSKSLTLLHNHLGHPNLLKLLKMVSGLSNLESLSYESCQLGKHSCSSFPRRVNKQVASLFESVYSNVWGLCRVSSILRF